MRAREARARVVVRVPRSILNFGGWDWDGLGGLEILGIYLSVWMIGIGGCC